MRTDTGKERRRFKVVRGMAGGLGVAILAGLFGPAQATFHLMSIVEVFAGTPASPNAQYVVLQMYSPGQNLVQNHDFIIYNASGQMIGSFVFPNNVANGADQARILIATPEARTFFNVQPDFTMAAQLMKAGGKVCFADGIDCVAWGAYTGSASGVGTPFNRSGGLNNGRAMARRLDISGSGGRLDATDDTDDSANDFRFDIPEPKNNAGNSGHAPASTCGNARIEGLEQCDDGNTSNGDRCNSTCSAATTPTQTRRAYADFNADGVSDVPWRNPTSGSYSVWRSATTSSLASGNLNPAWNIVGIGDFSGDGRADLLWRNTMSGSNSVWRSGSGSAITAVAFLNTQWQVAGVGDFNGDLRADILWRNGTTGANVIWRSANSAAAMAVSGVATSWRVAGIGDFNGDGRADIFWRSSGGSNIIWRSGSSGLPTNVTFLGAPWTVAGIGDFNSDGRDDVLWRNTTTGANVIWRSASSASAMAVTGVSTTWRVAAVGDYNGDRRSDIFWRSTGGSNVIWRSASSGSTQAVAFVPQPWTVAR